MAATGRPAAFIDRDGTLIVEREYLADPDRVELVPGAVDALRRLEEAGYARVVVTNQSGIARGWYGEDDYRAVLDRINELLAADRVSLDAVLHCPHHPDFTGPCDCRKPGPGMYRAASEELALAPERSWFVGDKLTDVAAAARFGGRAVLVRTGYGREEERLVPQDVEVADDMPAAADLILAATRRQPRVR